MTIERQSLRSHSRLFASAATLVALMLGSACKADNIVSVGAGDLNRRVEASVGDRIEITLGTIGPGEYASPPVISTPAVAFLDEAEVGPSNPGGPTQQFRFRAATPGTAIVTFTHTENSRIVMDTVVVR